MKTLFTVLVLAVLLSSCGSGNEQTQMRDKIIAMEDSITVLTKNLQPGEQLNEEVNTKLIDLLTGYYRKYPNDIYAPEYLDKVHMVYSAMGKYDLSTKYADTLMTNYKDYINRAMILESQASTYDIFLQPRDTSKVRYYYELLLKETPDLSKDKIREIRFRLKNLHLTVDELIIMQGDSN